MHGLVKDGRSWRASPTVALFKEQSGWVEEEEVLLCMQLLIVCTR